MRLYEIVMRSGAKTEVTAEVMHDDPAQDTKVYFFRDKGMNQLVAFFIRNEIAGIVLGPDTGTSVPRHK